MSILRRAMAYVGSLLLVWSGTAVAKSDQQASSKNITPRGGDFGQDQPGSSDVVETSSGSLQGVPDLLQLAQAHVNSGPTTHTNVPGHANFTMKLRDVKTLSRAQIQSLKTKLGGGSTASHVNSGPTTHTNRPGHANFTMKLKDSSQRLNTRQVRMLQGRLEGKAMVTVGRPGAQSHVNSGPTTHSNVPGHANFSMKLKESKLSKPQIKQFQNRLRLGGGSAAAHVNSGPTTHSNIGNHYNFSKTFQDKAVRLNSSQIKTLQNRLEGRSAAPMRMQPQMRQQMPMRQPGGTSQYHVNSGPTSHSNTGGHANFSLKLNETKLSRQQIQSMQRRLSQPGGSAAAHVNSGPTTHSNIGNHYNFSKTLQSRTRMNPTQIKSLEKRLETLK